VGASPGGKGLAEEGSRRWAEDPRRPETLLFDDFGAQPSLLPSLSAAAAAKEEAAAPPPSVVLGGGGGGGLVVGGAPFPPSALMVASRSVKSARSAVRAPRSSAFSP